MWEYLIQEVIKQYPEYDTAKHSLTYDWIYKRLFITARPVKRYWTRGGKMKELEENKICLIIVLIVTLLGTLVFATITNKTKIDKLEKEIIILMNKEKRNE